MPTLPVNENELLAAVLRYQETRSETHATIALALIDPIVHGMLGRAATISGIDFSEAYQRIRIKIWKALKTYQPQRGSKVYSYFNAVTQNYTRTICNEQLRNTERFERIEQIEDLPVEGWRNGEALEDICHRLLCLKTICTLENEIRASQWLVKSLIQSEFTLRRHESVRALQIVFSIDLKVARLVHDRVWLEMRRCLVADREKFPAVSIAKMRDKRERGLIKYRPFLSEPNFRKLVFLLHGLAPALIGDLIERETKALNGDRCPQSEREVIRRNLGFVLEGYPEARPLFST